MIDYQKKRYVHAIEQYETIYCPDKVAIFSAPGRSEVCGNHTDHQHGMVLATSINLDTIAVSAKNNNDVVRYVSDGYDMITLDINDLEVNNDEAGTTVSLIRGVLRGLKDHGYKIGGFNAYATSDVLVGAGLSSSAAFEVVVGTIISGLYNDARRAGSGGRAPRTGGRRPELPPASPSTWSRCRCRTAHRHRGCRRRPCLRPTRRRSR